MSAQSRGRMISSKTFALLGLAGFLWFLGSFYSLRVTCASEAREVTRIGYPSTSALWWPFFVAKDKGLYDEQGLAAELVLIRGAPTVVQALVAREIDFAGVGTIAALTAYFNGASIVAISGVIGKSPFQIYSTPDINSVAELKQKTIAIGAAGGPPDYAMTSVLRASGIEVGRDVKAIYMGSSGARLAALENRQVAATVLSPPFTFTATSRGLKMLADAREFLRDDQNDIIATSRDLLKTNSHKARKFVAATVKAMRLINTNRSEAIRILGKYSQQPQQVLEQTYDFFVPSISERVNVKGMQNMVQYLKDRGAVKSSRGLEAFIDLSFVQ